MPEAKITKLEPYRDDLDNEILYDGDLDLTVDITIKGARNRLVIAADANLASLKVLMAGDDGLIEIGGTPLKRMPLRFYLKCGYESTIRIGENIGTDTQVYISAAEGVTVHLGSDCMVAAGVQLRSDDTHALYDVRSGKRINPAHDIHIGDHVWLGRDVVIMGGVTIGNGSMLGLRSIVTRSVPNNCVAVGSPARVIRRNVVWERPELHYYRPGELDNGPVKRTEAFWNETDDSSVDNPAPVVSPAPRGGLRRLVRGG